MKRQEDGVFSLTPNATSQLIKFGLALFFYHLIGDKAPGVGVQTAGSLPCRCQGRPRTPRGAGGRGAAPFFLANNFQHGELSSFNEKGVAG